jgi:hypothetical protein
MVGDGVNLAAVQPGAGSFLGDSGWVNPQLAETVGLPGSADCWCDWSLWGEPAVKGRIPKMEQGGYRRFKRESNWC